MKKKNFFPIEFSLRFPSPENKKKISIEEKEGGETLFLLYLRASIKHFSSSSSKRSTTIWFLVGLSEIFILKKEENEER